MGQRLLPWMVCTLWLTVFDRGSQTCRPATPARPFHFGRLDASDGAVGTEPSAADDMQQRPSTAVDSNTTSTAPLHVFLVQDVWRSAA